MIIINLLAIKSGGGLQNSLSFIHSLDKSKLQDMVFIVTKGVGFEEYLDVLEVKYYLVPNKLISRLTFETTLRYKFPKNAICFTYFGLPMISSINYFHNINGFAYSNLLHEEVDFWQDLSFLNRAKRKLIDLFRLFMISKSNELIFETPLLLKRARQRREFQNIKLHLIDMSPSSLVTNAELLNTKLFNNVRKNGCLNILYIAGSQHNKRIHYLPSIALYLKERGFKTNFITTLPESQYLNKLNSIIEELGVDDSFTNVGKVRPEDVQSLLWHCDCVINTARLESFSNNIVEAWSNAKPLVITDSDWAKSICGEAALYVDFDKPLSFLNAFQNLQEKEIEQKLIKEGKKALKKMPTVPEKNAMYFRIIERQYIDS